MATLLQFAPLNCSWLCHHPAIITCFQNPINSFLMVSVSNTLDLVADYCYDTWINLTLQNISLNLEMLLAVLVNKILDPRFRFCHHGACILLYACMSTFGFVFVLMVLICDRRRWREIARHHQVIFCAGIFVLYQRWQLYML